MSISTDVFINAYTHLKDKPTPDRALTMLKRISSLVKPIMRKHRWTLPVLAEFFPKEDNLLGMNVNRGQKILIRLRPANSPDSFYEEEQLCLVMLHELTHNVHGPHDEHFYKFLSGLEDEYYELKRSGYSGEGFYTKGNRLGANVSHDLPPHLAKSKALAAAEQRRRTAAIMGEGGKLGGIRNAKNLSPRELAAQAAERRARDQKACGCGADAQREADKAANESITNIVIDLTGDSDSDSEHPVKKPRNAIAGSSKLALPLPKRSASSSSQKPSTRPVAPKSGSRTTTLPAMKKPSARSNSVPYPKLPNKGKSEWTCFVCTLDNTAPSLQCDACGSNRPPDPSAGWICLSCGESGIPHEFWTCRTCGTVKTKS